MKDRSARPLRRSAGRQDFAVISLILPAFRQAQFARNSPPVTELAAIEEHQERRISLICREIEREAPGVKPHIRWTRDAGRKQNVVGLPGLDAHVDAHQFFRTDIRISSVKAPPPGVPTTLFISTGKSSATSAVTAANTSSISPARVESWPKKFKEEEKHYEKNLAFRNQICRYRCGSRKDLRFSIQSHELAAVRGGESEKPSPAPESPPQLFIIVLGLNKESGHVSVVRPPGKTPVDRQIEVT